jgi:hypothetical protein
LFAILLLLAINPQSHLAFDRVDRITISHVYNGDGSLVLDQVIFETWSVNSCRWEVIDWRLLEGVRRHDQQACEAWQRENTDGPPYVAAWIGGHATPRREGRYCISEWLDGKSKKWRRVVADQVFERWDDFDPELRAREILPEAMRRKLR